MWDKSCHFNISGITHGLKAVCTVEKACYGFTVRSYTLMVSSELNSEDETIDDNNSVSLIISVSKLEY